MRMKIISRKMRAAVALAVMMSGTSVASAAEIMEDAAIDSYDMEDVIVTATRTKLSEEKVPMSATVITAEEMEKTGVYNVRDALKAVTGLNVMEASMVGNKVSIRGMNDNATLVLVDGRRMAGEDSGSTANVYELARINIADVERVEIIRGSGSALYGSDAMGGVINVILKKQRTEGGYAGVKLGSREQSQYGGYSTGPAGKLSVNFNYNITKVRKNFSESSASSTTNMYGPKRYFDFKGAYAFDDNQGLEFGASFMQERYTQDGASSSAVTEDSYNNDRSGYFLKYYGGNKKNEYDVQVYHNHLKKEYKNVSNDSLADFDHADYKTTNIEAKNTYRANDAHAVTYGAEYQMQEGGGTRIGDGAGSSHTESYGGIDKKYGSASIHAFAMYLQDEWQMGKKLFFVPSVRYDHHDSFGARFSPRAGITYELSPHIRVKANYGMGYRAPTIFELYSQMDHTPGSMPMTVRVQGDKNLQAETSRNFDIGIEAERGKSKGKLTYFHNNIDNLIDSKYLGVSVSGGRRYLIYQYVNVNKAVIDGVELDYDYDFDKNWKLHVAYTYTDARDANTDARLTGRARSNGAVNLSYTDAKPLPLTATLANLWYFDYLLSSSKPGYTYNITNFVVSKEFAKNTTAYFGVDNIFDKTFNKDDDYYIYGRTWRAGVEVKF